MKYKEIDISCEPSVIGSNDGVSQTELLHKAGKSSFANDDEKNKFDEYGSTIWDDRTLVSIDGYTKLDGITPLMAYKMKKRVKEVDILDCVHSSGLGFDYLLSQKLIDILDQFSLPKHNRIKTNIEGFDTQYYLVGFPLISITDYDFSQSTFYNYTTSSIETFKDIDDYNAKKGYMLTPKSLFLNREYKHDVIYNYFSLQLLDEIAKHDIKAFEVRNSLTLETK